MLAKTVKEHRLALGYTQKELSDLSKISLRSIQRIENGKVLPRMYTIRSLADCLKFSVDRFLETPQSTVSYQKLRSSRLILSISSLLLLLLLALAFLAQSARFPETSFEVLLFWALVVTLATAMQLWIWKKVR